ncbi:MAG: CAP domain-containing protein [Nitrososphaerota archaeon]
MVKGRMIPGLLIGLLLLVGGGWWIGVAASLAAHRPIALTTSAKPAATIATTATTSAFVARVIARTNTYRTAHGCPALAPNAMLMRTAQQHSADMAAHDFTSHNSFSGATLADRVKAAGYAYTLVAENIAWGQKTPEQVVDLWFNEAPPNDAHRKNILNCSLRDIGVGYVYLASDPGKVTAHTYWTEDFGTRPAS